LAAILRICPELSARTTALQKQSRRNYPGGSEFFQSQIIVIDRSPSEATSQRLQAIS
jgi:hypothetical protein